MSYCYILSISIAAYLGSSILMGFDVHSIQEILPSLSELYSFWPFNIYAVFFIPYHTISVSLSFLWWQFTL